MHLTEEEISGNIKAFAVEEGSDNDLDEPQEYARRKKFLGLERDGIDVLINYVGCSTNRELQAYNEHLRIVREILFKEQQQRSLIKPALLRSKTHRTSESSVDK